MSNAMVGQIYSRIMQEVLESARVDFEEGGVDQATLEELKETWQRKLSSCQVATFPWDPPPSSTQPSIANTPTVPSNAHTPRSTQPAAVPSAASPPPAAGSNYPGVRIKTEPGYEQGPSAPGASSAAPNVPANPALNNPQAAAQRAASLMQEKFGKQATNSINTLQSGLVLPGSRPNAPASTPAPAPARNGQPQPQQYQPVQPNNTPQSQPPQGQQRSQQQRNGAPGVSNTDGADDPQDEWSAVMIQRNAKTGEEQVDRVLIDGMIRHQVEEMGKRMEGGGLMVPLSEHQKAARAKKRRRGHRQEYEASSTNASAAPPPVASSSSTSSQVRLPARFDGGDESESDEKPDLGGEDEYDADAINSDLDDPEDDLDDEPEEDEANSHIMLCMYDKVQRVKNKWKCVLKDGVLQVNGKEYLFHKATGEFEW